MTPASHDASLAGCFAGMGGETVTVRGGWDSAVVVIDDAWIARIPRRAEVVSATRHEVAVLQILGPKLPVEVPRPVAVCDQHGAMLYRRIRGRRLDVEMCERVGAHVLARQVAAALRAIHAVPIDLPVRAGAPDLSGRRWREHIAALRDRFRRTVLPHLDAGAATEAAAFLDDLAGLVADIPAATFIHRDLGSSHLLCDDGGLVGIIDWSDCCVGDPAVDLAWVVHGAPEAFSRCLIEALEVTPDAVRRAAGYHRLGPWFEAERGIESGDDALRSSGLRGVVERLPVGDR